jgi:argininosuccinate lyase
LFGRSLGIADDVVRNALDPMANLRLRTVTGGPAPVRMQEMVSRRAAALEADEARVRETVERIERADVRLESMVQALLA